MSPMSPLAFDAYERLAEAYSERVETKPHNAYYERPATLGLLPDVEGLRVLDAGCGPGGSERLADRAWRRRRRCRRQSANARARQDTGG